MCWPCLCAAASPACRGGAEATARTRALGFGGHVRHYLGSDRPYFIHAVCFVSSEDVSSLRA